MAVFTTPDGVRLNYREAGAGEPALLFVHGWASNLRHWDAQARPFARRHRVLRLDLRGHGRSDVPAGGYTIRQLADDVAAFARARRVRDAVVIGHSMGGTIGLELAGRAPELVRALVQIDAPMWRDAVTKASLRDNERMQHLRGEGWPAPLMEFYAAFFAGARDQSLAARVVGDTAGMPRAPALASMESLLTYRVRPAARRVRQPTLFISASQGAARWDHLRTLIPHVQFARVVGAGHFLQLESPDQCNAMLAEFVARL